MAEADTILWQADAERKSGLNITRFMAFLGERGHRFDGYQDLHHWSVTDLAGFWGAISDYFELSLEGAIQDDVTADPMRRPRRLTGARMNYAEPVLRHETTGDPARVMLHHGSELRPMATAS